MSWAGLKKATGRMGTQIMQKTGQADRTVDREFQDEEARYRTLEKNANALQKEAKAYLDAMRGMTAAQDRIADTIDRFYADNSEAAMAAHSYKRCVEDLDGNTARNMDAPYRATVLEPIGKLCSYLPEVNKSIEKRNHKLMDHDAARTKLRKLTEKPSDDGTKLPRAEKEADDAKEVYETINGALLADLPQLLDLRIPYLDPSFEAMVRMQVAFSESAYEKLGSVQRYFPENVRDDYANGQLDAQVEGALQGLRDLSICA